MEDKKELWVVLEEIARLEGRIIVFTEKVRPEDFGKDMGTFIANVCVEYKDDINEDAGNSNVLVAINYMHNKNDIRDCVKENYPGAKIYEIKYNYNLNQRGKYAEEAKEIPLNTPSAYDEE